MLLDVIRVETRSDYRLLLEFDNHEQRIFDVSPYLEVGVFRKLRDARLFRSAHIAGGTVTWPGDIDIAPETLYHESAPCSESMHADECRFEKKDMKDVGVAS